jgi:hypothetical protein
MKINKKSDCTAFILKTIKTQDVYSSIEDSGVVLVSESNNAGLKKLSKFCLKIQATYLPS